MKDAKVIEFPKSRSVRKRLQMKVQEQKSALVLSIASILVLSVFLNQWLVQGPEASLSANGSREIASYDSASLSKDVKWEQDLAKRIALDKSLNAARIAEAPTLRDELIFGLLEGKYGMKLAQGRIESLEFIDSQAGENPLSISDKADFLVKYSEAFGHDYSQVSLTQNTANEQVYSLINSSKEIVGTAHVKTDDEGRVQAIQFVR